MKPAPFGYVRPLTVEDAVAAIAGYDGTARVLAGGQSLVPMLHMRLMQPAALVDINRLMELDRIEPDGDGVAIGALTRYSTIERSPLVQERLPLLQAVVRRIGDRQVRNRGTIGGSLAQADPVGEMPLACLALGATVVARSVSGTREIPMEDFVLGAYTTALEPEELLVEVRFPRAPDAFRFVEVGRRHNDFAVVALVVVGERGGAGWRSLRIAIGGGDDHPLLVQLGDVFLDDTGIEAVVTAALATTDPLSDIRASEDYRRHLLAVHLRRLLVDMA